jgi:hypothetical protein
MSARILKQHIKETLIRYNGNPDDPYLNMAVNLLAGIVGRYPMADLEPILEDNAIHMIEDESMQGNFVADLMHLKSMFDRGQVRQVRQVRQVP